MIKRFRQAKAGEPENTPDVSAPAEDPGASGGDSPAPFAPAGTAETSSLTPAEPKWVSDAKTAPSGPAPADAPAPVLADRPGAPPGAGASSSASPNVVATTGESPEAMSSSKPAGGEDRRPAWERFASEPLTDQGPENTKTGPDTNKQSASQHAERPTTIGSEAVSEPANASKPAATAADPGASAPTGDQTPPPVTGAPVTPPPVTPPPNLGADTGKEAPSDEAAKPSPQEKVQQIIAEHPEALVGGAFVGGFLTATILKALVR